MTPMRSAHLHYRVFVLLLALVSLAFFWLMLPFFTAIFWGTVLAVLFMPLNQYMLRLLRGRRNIAALITLIVALLCVILPLAFITGALVKEIIALYERISSGQLNFSLYFHQVVNALPPSLQEYVLRLTGDETGGQSKLASGVMQVSQFVASHAVSLGQNTLQFVVGAGIMMYLLFFLLRDGTWLSQRIRRAVPLSDMHKQNLARNFTTVVRATVKGNIAVAAAQGLLGGLSFWFLGIQGALLWGVVMAFLSLLPAVGASLIWGPVAIYFLVTGATWQGVFLLLFGILVIGLMDNILRPLLVGKDLRMPDYLVLISTLGGLTLFGLNGFVMGPLIAALFIAVWNLFVDIPTAPSTRHHGQNAHLR